MAIEEALQTISLEAAADLSASQYCFVKVDSNGRAALAGDGDSPIGVLQDKPGALGRACCVAVGGKSKVQAGGSVTKGGRVAVGANGKAVAVASGDDFYSGIALDTLASGKIGTIMLQPTGLP